MSRVASSEDAAFPGSGTLKKARRDVKARYGTSRQLVNRRYNKDGHTDERITAAGRDEGRQDRMSRMRAQTEETKGEETRKRDSPTEETEVYVTAEEATRRQRELEALVEESAALIAETEPPRKKMYMETREEQRHRILRAGREKYPTRLDGLLSEDRVSKHVDDLRSILKGNRASQYMDKLREYAGSRELLRVTTADLAYDRLVPGCGYYGPVGGQTFSLVLQRVLEDDIASARKQHSWLKPFEAPQICTCLLVPELLVRLVAEDRSISLAEASTVLDESTDYGNIQFDTSDVEFDSDSDSDDEVDIRRDIEADNGYSDSPNEFE